LTPAPTHVLLLRMISNKESLHVLDRESAESVELGVMAIVIMLGAEPLASLMAADRLSLGSARASSYPAPNPNPSLADASAASAGEGALQRDKKAPSLRASKFASRVSHSQTTSAAQPADRSAFSEAESRVRLRSIFVRQ